MSKNKWNIKGFIFDNQTKIRLPRLQVEAWDRDKKHDDLLGQADTNEQGEFHIVFDEAKFKDHPSDYFPDIYLIIRHQGKVVHQSPKHYKNQPPGVLDWGQIEVDLSSIENGETTTKQRQVRGRIQWSYRQPVKNATVILYDQGMDADDKIELGRGIADEHGRYTISYDPAKLSAGKTKGDLYIQAAHNGSTGKTDNNIRWNANDRETIDLTLEGREPSEYQRLVTQLTPILNAQNKTVTALEKTHITYLAKKTKLNATHIGYYVDASKLAEQIRQYISQIQSEATLPESEDGLNALAEQTGIAVPQIQALKGKLPSNQGKSISPDQLNTIPEILYGLWRENMPVSLIDLLAKGMGTLQAKLIAAKDKNIINQDGAWLADYHAQLAAWAAMHTASQQKSDFATYLEPINLGDAGARVTILQTFAAQGRLPDTEDDVWKNFKDKGRTKRAMESVIALEENGRFLPVVKAIQDNELTVANQRALAMYDANQWQQYLTDANVPQPNELAQTLISEVRRQFSTVLLGTELGQLAATGEAKFDNPLGSEVADFLRDHEDFYLDRTVIDDYPQLNPAGDPISQKPLKEQLKRHQRVFAFAREGKQMDGVMGLGINSAHEMMRLPQKTFQKRYADLFPEDQQDVALKDAQRIYARAKHIASRNLINYTNYALRANEARPMALDGPPKRSQEKSTRSVTDGEQQGSPDWESLFGPLPSCDYPEWRTVYSPAAYYVDLLEFLKHAKKNRNNETPQGVLFNRRPDLKNLELSEANTNTVLPYIDLVNEVLEYYVATEGKHGQEGVWNTSEKVTAKQLEVVPENYPLPKGYAGDAGEDYTSRAYSEVNTKAYPFTLPFDADTAVIRTYLKQLNSSPIEIIQANHGLSDSENDNSWSLEMALAQLNLSLAEKEILSGEKESDLGKYYGYEHQADWLEEIAKVKVFLKRTGLTYAETEKLFKTQFINSDETISLDASCDLETAKIENLSATALEKIYRFIRLWRKLDWSIEDTDQVIHKLRNEPFPLSLSLDLSEEVADYLTRWTKSSINWEMFLSDDELWTIWKVFRDEAGEIFPLTVWTINYLSQLLVIKDKEQQKQLILHFLNNFNSILRTRACKRKVGELARYVEQQWPQDIKSGLQRLIPIVVHCMPENISIIDRKNLLTGLPEPKIQPSSEWFAKIASKPNWVQFIWQLLQVENEGEPLLLTFLSVLLHYETNNGQHKQEVEKLIAQIEGEVALPSYDRFLIHLAQFKQFHEDLSIPISSLISFWYTIGTLGETSLYEQLFQNPTIQSRDDLERFKLNGAHNELSNAVQDIKEQQQIVAAVLQIDTADFNLLHNHLKPSSNNASLKLNLANLSALYRHVQLARALNLTISELLTIKKLLDSISNSNPFDSDIASTFSFVETVRKIQDSPFSIPQLAYIFSQSMPNAQTVQLSKQAKDTLIEKLKEGVEVGDAKDAGGTAVAESLKAHIQRTLSEELNTGIELTTYLLETLQWPDATSVGEYIQSNLVDLKTDDSPEEIQKAITFLHKCTLLLSTFKLSKQEVNHLLDHKDDFDGFSLEVLNNTDGDAVSFKLWEQLFNLCQLRDSLPQNHISLLDVFEKAKGDSTELKQELIDSVADLFNWNKEDLASLVNGKLSLSNAAFRDEVKLIALQRCLRMAKRLGVTAVQLHQWSCDLNNTLKPNDALSEEEKERLAKTPQEIVGVVKAKYDNKTWLKVAEPLNDRLREQRRDALVTYILHHDREVKRLGHNDINDLLGYFLLDVGMSACMPTSRLVQATAAVQLFVQRCFMSLEDEVSPGAFSDGERERWQWLKNYRKWELNQKVFLYPENVLRPELRKDKSPFFAELEQELLQNELTEENIETAVYHYLEKLEEVARLEICGIYWEEDSEILHLFGRTNSEPHIYYYRRWLSRQQWWTPWEKVDLDIEGNHLIPVIRNKQLYLFWPLFEEKQKQDSSKFWAIKLAWSQYNNKSWSTKKTSQQLLCSEPGVIDQSWNFNDESSYLSIVQDFLKENKWPYELIKLTPNPVTNSEGEPIPPYIKMESEFDIHVPAKNEIKRHFFRTEIADGSLILSCYRRYYKTCEQPEYHVKVAGKKKEVPNYGEQTKLGHFTFLECREQPEVKVIRADYDDLMPEDSGNVYLFEEISNRFYLYPHQETDFGGFCLNDSEGKAYLYLGSKEAEEAKLFFGEICCLVESTHSSGFSGLFSADTQALSFSQTDKALDMYRWELYFHIPLLIASQLNKDCQFFNAQLWYHHVFNPTSESYWKFLPFANNADAQDRALYAPEEFQIWEDNPFDPHAVAQIRQEAYQKQVVMLYVDNLLDWGDHLFSLFTRDSVNEALQLYALAYSLLGASQELIIASNITLKTYDNMISGMILLENVLVSEQLGEAGGEFINKSVKATYGMGVSYGINSNEDLNAGSLIWKSDYFGLPQNQQLLSYWSHVRDRFYKIRHCQDIEGIKRELALFAPPLDFEQLLRSSGIGDGRLGFDSQASLPHYRFQFMLQKALEFCNDVKSLGNALLSALEKRDAEQLSLLRSGHEKQLLKAVKEIKSQQLLETESSLESLLRGRELTQERLDYYSSLKFMNALEISHLASMGTSVSLMLFQSALSLAASPVALVPEVKIGSPLTFGTTFGGSNLSSALQAYGSHIGTLASIASTTGSTLLTLAGYQRRSEEWDFQTRLAEKELKQIDEQIKAANIRIEIAKKELQNHETQIKHAEEVGEFLQDKFTNAELYSWMSGQISTLHFQSYQMALILARQAQRAFEHELGLETQNFIQPNHWNSLRKGLLAGEHLYEDLKKMELAYIENNKRLHELTKNISLALLHQEALIMLRETGSCHFNLPEAIFDLDHPGHYMRRIKSMSLSIPCVTGPYTSVSAKLTLQNSRIRKNADLINGGYAEQMNDENPSSILDPRFTSGIARVESIATSSGQNDSGMFELNFRDERYLPFEGAGVISQWKLELPNEFRQFDYDTISDD
jgi:hypothetical protein